MAVSTGLMSVVATVGGAAYGAPTGYLFCTASSPQQTAGGSSQRAVTYFSGTFATEDGNTRPVSNAFLKYLEAKYAFKPLPDAPQPVICTNGNSLDDAQSLARVRMRKAALGGGQVVETGWTYAPEASGH